LKLQESNQKYNHLGEPTQPEGKSRNCDMVLIQGELQG
jgi:hypothetical protein